LENDDAKRPNPAELKYLNLAYTRFYDIFDEAVTDSFWEKDKYYRFCKIRDAFSVYAELLSYEPLQWVIDHLRINRPPMEAEIGSDLFKLVRNVLAHFPVFESWEDVYIDMDLVNWNKPGQTIDKFCRKYENHATVKYRYWQSDIKKMTYISINFPTDYSRGSQIWLRDLISERDGVVFSMIFMRHVLDTQVEKMGQIPENQE
jgi:hypothetical protein